VNVRGTIYTISAVLPVLSNGGSIVLVSSVLSQCSRSGYGMYSASKAAIRSFGRTWARELLDRKIRVNVLSPGAIETPMIKAQAPDKEQEDRLRTAYSGIIPMGRIGEPAEIATAALFLASDDSSYMTGGDLCIDGGFREL
jgi:NAD(P)-dependent dehydrogenase (short-subunit alcohol dehydrogenase family)